MTQHESTVSAEVLGLRWRSTQPTGSTAPTLARLMIWLSPAYPVGGYSYSHGLEWTVEAGKVGDAATLGGWIEDVLAHGAGRSDVIFLAEAWRALAAGDAAALEQAAELAAALAPSAERRLETMAQGTAFLAATLAAWPRPELEALAADGREVAYPIAVGAARGRARPAAGRDGTGVRAGLRRQPRLGRRAPHPARAERRPARAGAARAADPARRRRRARPPASTTSAARRSPPTSPPCGTRRSIRGSSDREAEAP